MTVTTLKRKLDLRSWFQQSYLLSFKPSLLVILLLILIQRLWKLQAAKRPSFSNLWNYFNLKEVFHPIEAPFAVVDLDVFDENVRKVNSLARQSGKYIRVASKSLRVPELICRIMSIPNSRFCGTFT